MSALVTFDQQVVVVTGAGAGLGKSYALAFAQRGAQVVVNDLGGSVHGQGASASAADQVVAEIMAAGGQAIANYDSVENGDAIIQTAMDHYGRVDVVINNAGILRDRSFTKMTDEDWDLVYRVHLLGAYKVTHAVWPIMREQGYGRIINTSSAAGIYGSFGQANYSACKLGLYGLTQTLATEGRKYNIQVNAIAPIAASRLMATVAPQEVLDALNPELVTPLVLRLCAEHNAETGALFEVGGGWMGKVRWQRNQGIGFDPNSPLTPEQIDQQWQSLTDFIEVEYPQTYTEAVMVLKPIFDNLDLDIGQQGLGPQP